MNQKEITILALDRKPDMAVTYLVFSPEEETALVVDPGQDADDIIEMLKGQHKRCGAILLTHGHYDHIRTLDEVYAAWGEPPVYLHEGDAPMLTDPYLNVSPLFGLSAVCETSPILLKGGEVLSLCGLRVQVLHTPGHTPGCLCYRVSKGESHLLLSGDTLFYGSVGRWDFPGSDLKALRNSLDSLATSLPPATDVYPGHGEPTTIGREKRDNFFLKGR